MGLPTRQRVIQLTRPASADPLDPRWWDTEIVSYTFANRIWPGKWIDIGQALQAQREALTRTAQWYARQPQTWLGGDVEDPDNI